MPQVFVVVLTLTFLVLITIGMMSAEKRGKQTLRTIAGVVALREGIARAVEMGRPVLFHFGTLGLATGTHWLAPGISLLHRVADLSGELNAHLIATVGDPLLLSLCQDVIKQEYALHGRTEDEVDARYLAPISFPYVTAMLGFIEREKPGAHFLMGTPNFEAVILCEAASSVGAFQVAGSVGIWQLPMFIATCDYTLLGEEFVVAGAIVSDNVGMLGTVAGQDWSKAVVIALIIFGCAFAQLGIPWLVNLM